ncbi:uncharacterized protein C5L36_0C00830 [Pichia kudriavzevii]|uniref:Sm-like protein LSM6A n=1 Tax=Pichia kudriavzevii TaxID=4909 RepID=A0A1V2LKB1_PICKU|nr:uncharacterized protein C5L36_0C00830 [Pichia kudriavzevii]AWU76140.1 hypothetical protein C5L36_0C00830 [Pichia kudriavzevii]ONH72817.1 Sm-like protein LSM6A [Pichia kudriavzevii]
MSNTETKVQSEESQTPDITASFLSSITNKPVNVKIYDDFIYTGTLASIDGYMNIVLQNAEEIVRGKSTNTYEEIFIRGNNVLYISMA